MFRLGEFLEEDFRFDSVPRVVPWLEGNISLPEEMAPASPGPFRVRSHPHTAPILECFHPLSGVRSCVFTGGGQDAAKTTTMCLGIAFRVKFSPMPTMIFGPTKEWLGTELSDLRMGPLIRKNPELAMEMPFNSDEFKRMFMKMSGGPISFVGANSDTGLAGGTKGIVAGDEAAKIRKQSKDESEEDHPLDLAEVRMKHFRGQEFFWLSSTPNTPQHKFWEHFEKRDQTHFYYPCPHCGEYFRFEFELSDNKKFEPRPAADEPARPKDYRSVIWSPDALNKDGSWDRPKVLESARYVCPKNGCVWEEKFRVPLLQKFEQRRLNPNAPKEHRSFRAPSFLARGSTLGEMAWKFLDRGKTRDLFTSSLQTFTNSWLALPWEEEDINIQDTHIEALLHPDYEKGEILGDPAYIALTGDAGQRTQHWLATAIMPNEDLYVIDWGTCLDIEDFLGLHERHAWKMKSTGQMVQANGGLTDSAYETDRVYTMCARSNGFWWPVRGSDASYGNWGVASTPTHPSIFLYKYVDKSLKDELYDRRILQKKEPRVFLPRNASAELKHSLSGQKRVKTEHGAAWKRVPHDHWGDDLKEAVLMTQILKANGQLI